MKAVITTKNTKKSSLIEKLKNSNSDKLIDKVSCSKSYIWPESKKNKKLAVVVDLGVDFTLLNWLSDKGYKAKVVPFDYDYKKMLDSKPDVIVFSNGPQGPANYIEIINKSRKLTGHVPLVGYGLGNIILGMSLGLKSYKMKSGHHGSNYPIKDITSNKTYMTAQDHLYCLRDDSIKDKNEITAVNLNDGSVEGFQNKKQKISGFNYLPEVLNI
jgi:carbamoyl-phosphate synthase small subunit